MGTVYDARWFMTDLARMGRKFDRGETTMLLQVLQRCGYNGLGLYIEGYFRFPEIKTAPRVGCMDADDAAWIMEEAKKYDITIIPMTNLVGHAESFLSQEKFRHLGRDAGHFNLHAEGFKEFAFKIIDQFIDCFHPEIMHIGGDEVVFNTEQERIDYIEFMTETYEHLKKHGITTAIWGDVARVHFDIGKNLPKDMYICNWDYYGHRLGLSEQYKNIGFNNIVVCPGTQSWNSIVGTQHITPWLHETVRYKGSYMPLEPDEVEALLVDAEEEIEARNAFLTDWENFNGSSLWNSLHLIARFGQYINGKPLDDDSLMQCLFGRSTPYMECIRAIMDAQNFQYKEFRDHMVGRYLAHAHEVDAVYAPLFMNKIFQCADLLSPDLITAFYDAAAIGQKALDRWEPQSDFEEFCKRNMQFSVLFTEVTAWLFDIGTNTKAQYREASELQYSSPEKYSALLHQVQQRFYDLCDKYNDLISAHKKGFEGTGQTQQDIERLVEVQVLVRKLGDYITPYDINGSKYQQHISLPSWPKLLSDVLGEYDIYF